MTPTPHLRSVTFGCPLDAAAPQLTAQRVKRLLHGLQAALADAGITSRCYRYVAPPLEEALPDATPRAAAELAKTLEQALGDGIWCCLPGPACDHPDADPGQLDATFAMLAATERLFTNVRVGGPTGIHNAALEAAASTMAALAEGGRDQQSNFRFAAIANVEPGTPYFPAAWHRGGAGFSVALELAALFHAACARGDSLPARLAACREALIEVVGRVRPVLEAYAAGTGTRFLGFDLSLAPFPGEGSSAVRVVELLNGSRIGQLDFLFSLYATNDLLQHAIPGLPLVGFNGTMLSVLEDNRLAEAAGNGEVGIKDLLLYATVCGCGLDMIPLRADTSPVALASLVRAVATIAQKWRKPLLARLLPSDVDADGRTRYEHEFLVNTRVMAMDARDFLPTPCFGFFQPERNAPTHRTESDRPVNTLAGTY